MFSGTTQNHLVPPDLSTSHWLFSLLVSVWSQFHLFQKVMELVWSSGNLLHGLSHSAASGEGLCRWDSSFLLQHISPSVALEHGQFAELQELTATE